MNNHSTEAKTSPFEIAASLTRGAEAKKGQWCLIGSMALALHGENTDIVDVDIITKNKTTYNKLANEIVKQGFVEEKTGNYTTFNNPSNELKIDIGVNTFFSHKVPVTFWKRLECKVREKRIFSVASKADMIVLYLIASLYSDTEANKRKYLNKATYLQNKYSIDSHLLLRITNSYQPKPEALTAKLLAYEQFLSSKPRLTRF